MAVLGRLYEWFLEYVSTYYTKDPVVMHGVSIKEIHSQRVAAIAARLARHLRLTERQKIIAEVIGLFHDISRFRQITEYRTFIDSASFDHGDAGAQELAKLGILSDFSPAEVDIINFAIINHNKMLIGPASPEHLLFAKIIRDADKLDIFRILPPVQADHEYSPKLINQLKQGSLLSYTDVLTAADKRLIRLSWFYDINFDWTLNQLVSEGHLKHQLEALPDTEDCTSIKAVMTNYVRKRIGTTGKASTTRASHNVR